MEGQKARRWVVSADAARRRARGGDGDARLLHPRLLVGARRVDGVPRRGGAPRAGHWMLRCVHPRCLLALRGRGSFMFGAPLNVRRSLSAHRYPPGFGGIACATYVPSIVGIGAHVMGIEVSTIFLDLMWALRQAKAESTAAYKLSLLGFVLTFYLARVVNLAGIYMTFARKYPVAWKVRHHCVRYRYGAIRFSDSTCI